MKENNKRLRKLQKGIKGITLEWTQKIRQNWTWFNKGGII